MGLEKHFNSYRIVEKDEEVKVYKGEVIVSLAQLETLLDIQQRERERRFDCFDEGCGECEVCRYLNFREWAEGCAPAGSTIERNERIETYLKDKEQARKEERERMREKVFKLRTKEESISEFLERGGVDWVSHRARLDTLEEILSQLKD